MKRVNYVTFLLLVTILTGSSALSQDIATDNKGEPIFTVPSSERITPEVALKNIGVNFTALRIKKIKYYVMEGTTKYYTMDKSTVININANLVDNDDDVFTISKDAKLTPHVELGISRGIDALINPSKIDRYYTFSALLFADFQSFDLYDTVTKSFLPKYHHTSYGGKIGFNMFFKTKSAIAFNLAYKNSIVTDDQTSYQKKSDNTVYADNNIVTNGTSDGYLSPVDPSKNWRLSLAFPQFLKTSKAVAIIPYYFVKFGEGIPKNNAGIMFTVMNDKFRNFDARNSTDPNRKDTYSFETAFSVGLNLLSRGTKNNPFLFISGTITIGKSKKSAEEKEGTKSLF